MVFAGLALACTAHADATSSDDRGAELVRSFIDDIRTMSARFEQSLVDADDNIVEESSGTLEILRPGRFRWSYSEPYEQLLVADGLNVWSYDRDLEQVTVKPQAEVLGSTPALLLGGAGDVLAEFERAESFEDRGTTWVRLVPVQEDSGFASVDLGFTDALLSRMIFIDSLGQSTLIALFDVVTNKPIDEARFAFVPPADADLVGTPLRAQSAER
ncbi:MAG: outer membrane lipoprotein chaperone LolA [Woeseia sp.]